MITGTVEGVSTNYGKFSVLVDGIWYGTKAEYATFPHPNKGDVVEFDNGGEGKKYLQKVRIVSSGGEANAANTKTTGGAKTGGYSRGKFPIDPLDGQRSIIRQNAVTNANTFISNQADDIYTVEELIDVARKIEAYTAGDLDRKRAEELKEAEEG